MSRKNFATVAGQIFPKQNTETQTMKENIIYCISLKYKSFVKIQK